jgi:small subunit ribosomal protein S20
MAHHASAKKSIRKTEARTAVNTARKSRIRTFIKKVELALAAKDKDLALSSFKAAQPEIMRGVNKGVLKLNAASRKVSRLAAKVKALSLASAS